MVHVPPNGPAVHAEPAGEFGHRPDAARLAGFYEKATGVQATRYTEDFARRRPPGQPPHHCPAPPAS